MLAVWSGDIAVNTTWTNSEVQQVSGNVRVLPGVTLTIQPGTVVKFNAFQNLGLKVEGTLLAQGAAGQTIYFTTMTDDSVGGDTNGDGAGSTAYGGQWDAIQFAAGSTGSVLNHVEVRFGGSASGGEVLVSGGGSLTMTESTLASSLTAGIRIVGSSPTLTNTTFNSTTIAASMDLAASPTISGVAMTNNNVNALRVDGGSLAADANWNDPDIAYLIQDAVTVPVGRTLNIAAGQKIKFREFGNLGITVNGSLKANGSAAAPVIFTTTTDDTAGGDTYNNGAGTTSYAGQWDAITFESSSTGNVLDHVEVRYGSSTAAGQLVVNGGALTLTNSTLFDSLRAGVRILNSNPTLANVTFHSNGSAASMDLASNPAISGVTMTANEVNALVVDGGSLPADGVWDDPAITYLVNNAVTVPTGRTLTIAAGQVVKFREFGGLGITVHGTLKANGTVGSLVVFTTTTDDSLGGDTYNNGAGTTAYAGQWDALTFGPQSTASVLDRVEVRYGGSAGGGQIVVDGGQLTLKDSKLFDSSSAGIRMVGASPTLTNVVFQDNAIAASMDLASSPAISGVTMTNNDVNALRVDGGSLGADAVWDDPDVTYLIQNQVTIPAGRKLTIAAGQVVKFREFGGLGITVNGTMQAIGTPAAPVIFTTTTDDTTGGDTYNNVAGTTAYAGQWDALVFNATSTGSVLDRVEVRYGGSAGSGQIVVNGAPLAMSNSRLFDSSSAGIRMVGASPTLTNIVYHDNVIAASMDLGSSPVISGVTMTNNDVNALRVDGGTLAADATWNNPAIAYVVQDAVTVPAGKSLSIAAGQIVKFREFAGFGITVNGTLRALGASGLPVVFTTTTDDTVGGDTYNNGAGTTAYAGQWGAIVFTSTSSGNVLDDVELRYGGSGGRGVVRVVGGRLTLTDSKVTASSTEGLRIEGARPTVTNVSFENNVGAAISVDHAGDVNSSAIVASGNGANAIVIDGGTLAANATWTGQGLPFQVAANLTIPAGLAATIGPNAILDAQEFVSVLGAGTINNQGLIRKSTNGLTATIGPTIMNTGTIKVLGSSLNVQGGVTNNGGGTITGPVGPTLASGKDFDGTTTNGTFEPLTRIFFNGAGTVATPQILEAMSRDLANTGGGFEDNFALYSLALFGSTVVRLVDNANNAPGAGTEAVYVENLSIPSGTTLDLNNLKLYARTTQIAGAIQNGTVTVIADGGALSRDQVTPGRIAVSGEIDEWTIFGRAGDALTLTVSTGATGAAPPLPATINFAQVSLLDPSGAVLGTASNSTSGADVSLSAVTLPADGVYKVRVQAPASQSTRTGNYVLAAWNATVTTRPLELGRTAVGNIDTPFRADRWTFSAGQGQAVRFNLVNAESSAIQFDLTGPNGFTAFTNSSASSGIIALPTTGTYTVAVYGSQRQTGAYAFRVEQTSITPLSLNGPQQVAVAGGAQSQLFQFTVPLTQQLLISLADGAAANRNEIFVKQGAIPSRGDYQHRSTLAASANQQVSISSAAPGVWYVLVYTESAPQPGSFTLEVQGATVFLTDVAPDFSGNSAEMTLTLAGLGFDSSTTVSLVSSTNVATAASGVRLDQPTQITATFPAGLAAGVYSVRVTRVGGGTATLTDAFTVKQGGQAKLRAGVIAPESMGYHIPATLYIEYSNAGDVAMPAPLLILKPTQTHANGVTDAKALLTLDQSLVTEGFWTSAIPAGFSNSVQILASGSTPGVLQPGESARVPVYYAGWQQPWDLSYPPFSYQLVALKADDPSPMDWAALKSSLQPAGIEATAWDVIFGNWTSQSGTTVGGYIQALASSAAYLGQFGLNITDLGQLQAFAIAQAEGMPIAPQVGLSVDAGAPAAGLSLLFSRSFRTSISGRARLGPLGRGWSWDGPWEATLTIAADGAVIVAGPDGYQRQFQPDSRGGFLTHGADSGQLLATGGGKFQIREKHGLMRAFRADGRMDYIEDPNGQRITAGYTGNLLTSLSHASGAALQLEYNAAGRIIGVTDPTGRKVTYTYDANNEYLLMATGFDGRMLSYVYSTTADPERRHALTRIARPDGTIDLFGYDSRGRLNEVRSEGDSNALQLNYGSAGEVTVMDSSGSTTHYFDHRGLVVKTHDARGDAFYRYDQRLRMIEATDVTGDIYRYGYDKRGNLVQSSDPLGQLRRFTYAGPFDRLTSVSDSKGATIRYTYDAKGNLAATNYSDGSTDVATYASGGQLDSATNQRGQRVDYVYDTAGRLISKVVPGHGTVTYAYDAKGRLETITDAGAMTSLAYDTNDRLTQVTYPNGKFLKYSYDAKGRRSKLEDQTGFVLQYTYDDQGRLKTLADGSGAVITSYSYDSAGQPLTKQNANGSAATYEYDSAGRLKRLVNVGVGQQVVSRFEYGYDSLGQPTSMTTLEGVWAYSYDETGQLIRAIFTSNDPASVPHQDLAYQYDPAGNRLGTTINGVTTPYSVNTRGQYTAVGEAAYSYDADGNLIRKTQGGVTTVFTYDAENRLIGSSAPGDDWAYQYDAFGNLSTVSHNGEIKNFVTDPQGLGYIVGQYDGAGVLSAHFIQGGDLVGQIGSDGATTFFHYDPTGNTVSLTNTGGQLTGSLAHEPFGGILKATGLATDFKFGGAFGVMASGGGLSYMRARFYDPALGRFVEPDPLGTTADLNAYRYANNNPVLNVDPSGLALDPASIATLTNLFNLAESAGLGAEASTIFAALQTPIYEGTATIATQQTGVSISVPNLIASMKELLARNGLRIGGRVATGIASSAQAGATLASPAATLATPAATLVTPAATVAAPAAAGAGAAAEVAVGTGVAEIAAAEGIGLSGYAAAGGLVVASGIGGVIVGTIINEAILDTDTKEIIGDTLLGIWESGGRLIDYIGNGFEHSQNVASRDPNEKIGPAGFGTQAFVAGNLIFPYEIHFENDKDATAPAQRVTITDKLSSQLDWDSFRLTEIDWGDVTIAVPPDLQYYATTVDMTQNGVSFVVQVEAGIRLETGEVFAIFQSLDPESELPPPVLNGFLPPEDGTGRGQGHISYTIRPKANLASGTPIRNIALITFDVNPAIATDQVDPHDPSKGVDLAKQALVTIDAGLPTSSALALRTLENARFEVKWSGADDAGGSGIATYDVYVSDNGGPFTLWQDDIATTFATFTGVAGHSYRFYTIATDNVGHAEDGPLTFDASTTISTNPWQNARHRLDINGDKLLSPQDALAIINEINAFGNRDLSPAATGVAVFLDATGDSKLTPNDALDVINHLNAFGNGPAEGEANDFSALAEGESSNAGPDVQPLDALFAEWAEGEFDSGLKRRRKS
jgi:RHS repeat-associated protein